MHKQDNEIEDDDDDGKNNLTILSLKIHNLDIRKQTLAFDKSYTEATILGTKCFQRNALLVYQLIV